MRKQLVKSIKKPRKLIKYKQGYLAILWMKNETGRSRNDLMEKRQDNLWYIFISDRKASKLQLYYPAIKLSNLPSMSCFLLSHSALSRLMNLGTLTPAKINFAFWNFSSSTYFSSWTFKWEDFHILRLICDQTQEFIAEYFYFEKSCK